MAGANFKFIGSWLALDFANTVDFHARPEPGERLTSYEALTTWAQQAGIVDPVEGRRLRERAAANPDGANRALERAIAMRELIYRVFASKSEGGRANGNDVDDLNSCLRDALAHARVVSAGARFSWGWQRDEASLEAMLWPVVRSAADLLTSPKLSRVRQCASDDGCGWLFLDTSRNGQRRWCDMADCGNRAKARRHYSRRGATVPASPAVRQRPERPASPPILPSSDFID